MNEVSCKLIRATMNQYFFASTLVAGSVVLDIACNDGYGSLYMARNGARFVIGCDISKDCCIKAKKSSMGYENCEFVVCDASRLPFKNGVLDAIISLDTIEHLDCYEYFLSECVLAMNKRSTMVCSTPNRKATSLLFKKPPNPSHVREFYPAELFSLLKPRFEHVSLFGQVYTLTIVSILGQLKNKILFSISYSLRKRKPKGSMSAVLKFASCLADHEPKGNMPFNSYKKFVDAKYELKTFRDSFFHTFKNVICVARNPLTEPL